MARRRLEQEKVEALKDSAQVVSEKTTFCLGLEAQSRADQLLGETRATRQPRPWLSD